MREFNLGAWVLDNKRKAVGLILAILVIFIAFYVNLRFDNTPDSFFMEKDPTLQMYERFRNDFGSDEFTFIVLESPEVWTPQLIQNLANLTHKLEAMDAVTRVLSLTNARHIAGVDGAIDVGNFIDLEQIGDEQSLAALKSRALSHPFYRDFLISADGSKLGLLAETELRPQEVMYKIHLARDIRQLLASEPYSGYGPRLVGAPIIDADVFKIINIESALFGTLSFMLVALGFYFIFRSWVGVVVPLTVATFSIIVAVGLMGMMDAPAGLLTPIMPGFLISVGVGSSVFLLFEIYQQRLSGKNTRDSIVAAYRASALTCVISVATTAGALLSFSWSDIKPVQEVGLTMAGGLLASVVFALLLIPLALDVTRNIHISPQVHKMLSARNRRMEQLASFVVGRWRTLLVLLMVVIVFAAYGITKLRVDYYYVGLFKEKTEIAQSYRYVDSALRGGAGMELVIDTGKNSTLDIRDPSVMQKIAELQLHLESRFEHLGLKTYSVANLVQEINQALYEGQESEYRIPDSRAGIAEALFLYESSGDDELVSFITQDYEKARINLRLKYRPESEYAPLFREINTFVEREVTPNLENVSVTLTGVIPLWSRLTTYLYQTELEAITLSALIVTLVMILAFRSLQLGLAMMVCNLVPVATTLAIMGYFNIFLDPFTMLVAAIAIGMLDDDTMHFVRSFLHGYQDNGGDAAAALRHAYANAGQAMVLLSVVLVAGFLVYNFSSVASLAKFGSMTALAIGLGAASEFLFTPAVIMLCDRLGILPRIKSDTSMASVAGRETTS
jgi:predicted RND superfamily exporter protein